MSWGVLLALLVTCYYSEFGARRTMQDEDDLINQASMEQDIGSVEEAMEQEDGSALFNSNDVRRSSTNVQASDKYCNDVVFNSKARSITRLKHRKNSCRCGKGSDYWLRESHKELFRKALSLKLVPTWNNQRHCTVFGKQVGNIITFNPDELQGLGCACLRAFSKNVGTFFKPRHVLEWASPIPDEAWLNPKILAYKEKRRQQKAALKKQRKGAELQYGPVAGPAEEERQAMMRLLDVVDKQEPCQDTPDWANNAGIDCTWYSQNHCANNSQVIGTSGATHNYPEQNCCACGKSPMSSAEEKENVDDDVDDDVTNEEKKLFDPQCRHSAPPFQANLLGKKKQVFDIGDRVQIKKPGAGIHDLKGRIVCPKKTSIFVEPLGNISILRVCVHMGKPIGCFRPCCLTDKKEDWCEVEQRATNSAKKGLKGCVKLDQSSLGGATAQ